MRLFDLLYSLKFKMLFVVAIFVAGLFGVGFASSSILSYAKVNGPLYQQIIQNKDLLADVLPPPVFAMETYLVAYQIRDTQSSGELDALVRKYEQLKMEYNSRLEFWNASLPKGEIRDELLVRSRSKADAMFATIDQELIPAVRRNDRDTATTVLTTVLTNHFLSHRASIDNLSALTTQSAQQTEAFVANTIAWQTNALFASRIMIIAVLCGIASWQVRSLLRQVTRLEYGVARVISGELSTRFDVTSQDELGRLAQNINRMIEVVQETTAKATAAADSLFKNITENSPINIMYADQEMKLQYINPSALTTLKKLEKLLPVPAERMIGQSIDIFHKNPSYQRNLMADPKNLPRSAQINVGDDVIDLLVSPIFDSQKRYLGAMATWSIVTEQIAQQKREKQLTDNMAFVLEKVTESSTAMAAAAEELSAVSDTMRSSAAETSEQSGFVSAASEEVNRNTMTVASSIEEMTASIKEIAKNATEAARVATTAVKVAGDTNSIIAKLGDSSQEIGDVIKVITSIAQQTNLLALNATIEAARAGEAGKGFAVVANEVKELAKETAKATEDISKRIVAIQVDSKGAVDAIDQITGVINQINDISVTIASAVEEQTATTNEIGRSVAEASKGTAEITENITAVAAAAKSTTEGAANSNCAAQELARMAAELQEIVSQYNAVDEARNVSNRPKSRTSK